MCKDHASQWCARRKTIMRLVDAGGSLMSARLEGQTHTTATAVSAV
jgi:hypothetical protein